MFGLMERTSLKYNKMEWSGKIQRFYSIVCKKYFQNINLEICIVILFIVFFFNRQNFINGKFLKQEVKGIVGSYNERQNDENILTN
jgi:hypothetical protein